jgi:hypothetical protein
MLSDNITETILNVIKDITSIQIFQFEFWFRSNPTNLIAFLVTFVVFSAIVLFGASILIYNRIFKSLATGLIIAGIFGQIFTALNWQGVSFLGVRFFLLITFLAALGWSLFSLFLLRRKVPDQAVKYETGLIKRRYFSKKAK